MKSRKIFSCVLAVLTAASGLCMKYSVPAHAERTSLLKTGWHKAGKYAKFNSGARMFKSGLVSARYEYAQSGTYVPFGAAEATVTLSDFIHYKIAYCKNGGKFSKFKDYGITVKPGNQYVFRVRPISKKEKELDRKKGTNCYDNRDVHKSNVTDSDVKKIEKMVSVNPVQKAPNSPLVSTPYVKAIAHRGASSKAMQNSMEAFKVAGEYPIFWGIETDVHNTKDGKLIVVHDQTLKKLSNVSKKDANKNVNNMTYAEIEKYNLKLTDPKQRAKASSYVTNQKVPLFRDYLKSCRQSGKVAVVEVKGVASTSYYRKIINEIKEENMMSSCILICLHGGELEDIRNKIPETAEIPMMPLYDKVKITQADCDYLKANGYIGADIDLRYNGQDQIRLLKKNGLKVGVWTVTRKVLRKYKHVDSCLRMKEADGTRSIDFITMNSPLYAKRYCDTPEKNKNKKTKKKTKKTKKKTKAVSISPKKATLAKKEYMTLRLKNIKKTAKKTVKWTASNKKVKLSRKKKNSVLVYGAKLGKATVTASVTDSNKKTKKYKCKITVVKAGKHGTTKAYDNDYTESVTTAADTSSQTAEDKKSDSGYWDSYKDMGADMFTHGSSPTSGNKDNEVTEFTYPNANTTSKTITKPATESINSLESRNENVYKRIAKTETYRTNSSMGTKGYGTMSADEVRNLQIDTKDALDAISQDKDKWNTKMPVGSKILKDGILTESEKSQLMNNLSKDEEKKTGKKTGTKKQTNTFSANVQGNNVRSDLREGGLVEPTSVADMLNSSLTILNNAVKNGKTLDVMTIEDTHLSTAERNKITYKDYKDGKKRKCYRYAIWKKRQQGQ